MLYFCKTKSYLPHLRIHPRLLRLQLAKSSITCLLPYLLQSPGLLCWVVLFLAVLIFVLVHLRSHNVYTINLYLLPVTRTFISGVLFISFLVRQVILHFCKLSAIVIWFICCLLVIFILRRLSQCLKMRLHVHLPSLETVSSTKTCLAI